MKKFMALAAMFAAVMMGMTACGEPENKKPGPGPDEPDGPEALIKIDGDLSDWNALPAGSFTLCESYSATETPMAGMKWVKAYADDVYLCLAFEWDPAIVVDVTSWLPVHVYVDTDNSAATGGYHFKPNGSDIMLEGGIASESWISWDCSMCYWKGDVNYTEWDGWTGPDPTEANNWGIDVPAGGMSSGAYCQNNTYEIAIMREMLPAVSFADTFGVAIDIQQEWTSVGELPNAPATEANPTGLADAMIPVTIQWSEE